MNIYNESLFNQLTLDETLKINGGSSIFDIITGSIYCIGCFCAGFAILGATITTAGVIVGFSLVVGGVALYAGTVQELSKLLK